MSHYSATNIKISKLSIFSGYQVIFEVKGHSYQMLVGGGNFNFPMNIIHYFKEDGKCPVCDKYTLTYPMGQQPCSVMLRDKMMLFDLFQRKFQSK
ncbi:hypothetical protein M3175_07205 [Robertmurraya korlensis]|uniref:hypothetical protein n=1 Tax=Robertmurraya korlensis TaxID=519977 RepID=UPI00203CE5C5|nr:hypothetical protein [Robertmurraya korlensis]MCM3600512.1 hypothetical protein [Robertmurraya korlensis]